MIMSKLNRQTLDFIRRNAASMSDKQLAAELEVDVREVRKARKRMGLPRAKSRITAPEVSFAAPAPAPGPAGRVLAAVAGLLNNRLLIAVLLIAMCSLVAYMAMLPINNPDFGWHVALGRYIVEHGSVPRTEPFTHTAPGVPMVAHEWLAQVIYWLVIKAGGILTLRWVHAGLVVAVLLMMYGILRRSGVPPALGLLGTFLYLAVAQNRFHVRPHLFDLAFLVGLYGYVFVWRPTLRWRHLAAIILLTVLWVNLHSGVVLFAAVVVLYTAVEFAQQKSGWRRPQPDDLGQGDLRRLALLAVGVLLALVITPNTYHLFPYVLKSKAINTGLSKEWESITQYWGSAIMKPYSVETFWLLLLATGVTAIVGFRRHSLSTLAVVLFLAYLPISGHRFVAVYFAAIIFVLGAFSRWSSAAFGGVVPRGRTLARQLASVVGGVLVGALIYPVLNQDNKIHRYGDRLTAEWNFQPAVFPIGAATFLDEVQLDGRLFAPNNWGGYVLMRTYFKYPIFIDGRWVTIGEQVIRDSLTIASRQPAAGTLLDKYKIEVLLVERDWMTPQFKKAGDWICVFENFNAGVYLRNTPDATASLQRCAAYYRAYEIPFDPRAGFDERLAYASNRDWAKQLRVQRQHLSMNGRLVNGW